MTEAGVDPGKLTPEMKKNMAKKMKSMNFKSAMGKLIRYMKRYLPLIIFASLLSIAGTILNLLGPGRLSAITKLITDGLKTTIDVAGVVKIAISLLILYAIGFLCSYLQGQILAVVTQKASKGLRGDISVKINKLPLRYFDHNTVGDVLSRVTNDVDTLVQAMNQSLGSLVSALTLFVGSLVMMFVTNWIMAIAGVLSTLIGFALMSLILKRSQKYFLMQQYGLGALNGHIEETFSGHSVIKAFNGEKQAKGAFAAMNTKLYQSAWKSQFFSGMMPPIMNFVGNLGYVVVCVVGAVLTMQKVIGFEVIVAFMLYIRYFSQPLSQIAQTANSMQSAAAASDRVFRFLGETEMEEESKKTKTLTDVRGDVSFDHVRFGYDEGKTIIHDFSAEVKAGQKIAIVGPTGAGKTTMVNLLMRFYELNAGKIRIDGVPIDELTRENLHDLFCMVLQDTWLFEGTIKENVRYSKTDRSDEEIIRACKAVGLHHFIKTLPDGYDTVLSDNAGLSAGQRQLVTIARAMVENAPMLILDEATSSVDTRTEALIQKAMDELMKGRTSFVIAHRLSTIKNADLILVMKDGDILESGNHEELMKQGGFYADLYNSQFETSAA
ncbi:MAG: ABC transporter ATP-binding protein [Lachnospiraceae bacterium]|nr:ABC transporter ATP-binding protein [Lachnospiraceae bacterium]